ncbi:Hypothetical protein I5071_5700 [Sandaracinus amylolyticus]|nr:Hypothetical protein I5071_5700 [Sandaracinus amylolyticus]
MHVRQRSNTPLDGTTLRTARVPVGAGFHRVDSDAEESGVVYGAARFTSYLMMPLGAELDPSEARTRHGPQSRRDCGPRS